MRLCLSLLAFALATNAFAQPGQIYDPNAPTEPPPDVAPPKPPPGPEYQPPAPQYQPPAPQYQPQANSTHATFMSTGETRWDVRVDGNAVCTTPCSLYIEPLRFVTMHSQAENDQTKLKVGYMPPGDVLVRAEPRATGAFAAGVTFTTFSGMGVITGITLTAVGCSTDRQGMCNAGLITGVASAVGLYLSIGLIRSSMPRIHVDRTQPYTTGNTVGVLHRF